MHVSGLFDDVQLKIMRISSLTIVLPAFNEENYIEKTISTAVKTAVKLTSDYEILVVNDGSQDRTEKIIKKLSLYEPRIKWIHHPHQMGYGKALSSGFYNAKKEFVFYTDSDAPIDILMELPKAASLISDGVDAVIGYRINRKDTALRRTYSVIYNFMNRIFLGIKVHDINFSCKLFRRKIFDRFRLHSHSVFIDAEILANLKRNRLKVKEFPATYVPRKFGHSNFNSPIYALKIFLEILIFWITNPLLHGKSKKKDNV